ncbi:hypothetical protein Cni_G15992 [Canna indica]|uniref:Uncharacterized protein n=1 Tax=Canna indica TaxID=4628 RepID=A0AAQ3KHZ0_9LILI|nr:hypothetical protein Cni_G15992 [Canna indica]
MKDSVDTSKDNIEDLQFALRRNDDNSIREKVKACIHSRKETQKLIKKSYKIMTQTDSKCELASSIPQDSDVSVVLNVLKGARIVTRSLFCSIMSPKSMPKAKSSWWSFSSKATRAKSKDELYELKKLNSLKVLLPILFSMYI